MFGSINHVFLVGDISGNWLRRASVPYVNPEIANYNRSRQYFEMLFFFLLFFFFFKENKAGKCKDISFEKKKKKKKKIEYRLLQFLLGAFRDDTPDAIGDMYTLLSLCFMQSALNPSLAEHDMPCQQTV